MAEPRAQPDSESLRRMVVRLSRLVEISVTLNSTLEAEPLLQFIVTSAADLLESGSAAILLVDKNTKELQLAATAGADRSVQPASVPLEGSIAGTVFREQRPLILNEIDTRQGLLARAWELTHQGTRCLLAVPMLSKEEVIGVLEVANKRQGVFDEEDAHTLSVIASQAGVAIHNARLVNALHEANADLGRLDKLKGDFIAIASHELRTPLGVILGYAALLKDESGGDSSEHAEAVLHSALRMRSLVEDMTNLHLMGVAPEQLVLETCSLQDVARAACREVDDLVRANGQRLALRLPDEPVEASVDASRLTLALSNLLNNAVRFNAPQGSIELELQRRGKEAWFRVRDEGVGLEADQRERVFDPFYQVEDHMTRRHEGPGLGLAIVRSILHAHGGRAWAESAGPGQGTTFTLAVPVPS